MADHPDVWLIAHRAGYQAGYRDALGRAATFVALKAEQVVTADDVDLSDDGRDTLKGALRALANLFRRWAGTEPEANANA